MDIRLHYSKSLAHTIATQIGNDNTCNVFHFKLNIRNIYVLQLNYMNVVEFNKSPETEMKKLMTCIFLLCLLMLADGNTNSLFA